MSGKKTLYHLVWTADMGPLLAVATDDGLAGLQLAPDVMDLAVDDMPGRRGAPLAGTDNRFCRQAVEQVDAYLAGSLKSFDLPLDYIGTDFQMDVWRALLKIPFGKLVTYSQIARAVGRPKAARAVGNAVGANPLPIIIPCHRVVAEGHIGGFSSGLARKRILLGVEGVTDADLDQARLSGVNRGREQWTLF